MASWTVVCRCLLMVVVVVNGLPPGQQQHPHKRSHHPAAPEQDRVLVVAAPLMFSRYEEYDPERNTPSPLAVRSWWERFKVYTSFYKCPEGEKRDAIGICRQLWDGIDPDYDF